MANFALRTLATARAATPAKAARGAGVPTLPTIPVAAPSDPRVVCTAPQCRRLVQPEVMVDITTLPAALRASCGWSVVSYVCDACLHVARLQGKLTHEDLARAQGAPQDVLTRIAAIDAAQAACRFGKVGQQR